MQFRMIIINTFFLKIRCLWCCFVSTMFQFINERFEKLACEFPYSWPHTAVPGVRRKHDTGASEKSKIYDLEITSKLYALSLFNLKKKEPELEYKFKLV